MSLDTPAVSTVAGRFREFKPFNSVIGKKQRTLEYDELHPGLDYTRAAIHAEWGGSTQSDLPHKGGIVVAACLDAQLHPRAPLVILCGNGPGVRKVSDRLAQQARPLPIFIKQAPQRWVYQGRFQVIESLTEPADCAPYLVSSGRDPAGISQAILLRLIKQGTKTRLHDRLCHWPHWEGSSVSLRS